MIPVWASLIYCLTTRPFLDTLCYVCTVLVTLLATETCKALCSTTTRPEQILGDAHRASLLRRYGMQVSSLKSKHSFPSGDCAQAANLCFFLLHHHHRHLLCSSKNHNGGQIWVTWATTCTFGVLFLLGVCFARVFYHCHWIEDCIGGIVLSALLQWLVMTHVEAGVLLLLVVVGCWDTS
jgi:hypothetical protein